MFRHLIHRIQAKLAKRSSHHYIKWLRARGVKVGDRCTIFSPAFTVIDVTRPSLLEIGNDVQITHGCIILTHGYDWVVLRNVYGEVLASSGKVIIRDNCFIGMNSIILKGVTVGENTIIGAGSVVTRDVPPNSVVAGNPARVICTLAEYWQKRKTCCRDEAKIYARSIRDRFQRSPIPADFHEEFPLFLHPGELTRTTLPVAHQLGTSYAFYRDNHVPPYASFEAFLSDIEGDPELLKE